LATPGKTIHEIPKTAAIKYETDFLILQLLLLPYPAISAVATMIFPLCAAFESQMRALAQTPTCSTVWFDINRSPERRKLAALNPSDLLGGKTSPGPGSSDKDQKV